MSPEASASEAAAATVPAARSSEGQPRSVLAALISHRRVLNQPVSDDERCDKATDAGRWHAARSDREPRQIGRRDRFGDPNIRDPLRSSFPTGRCGSRPRRPGGVGRRSTCGCSGGYEASSRSSDRSRPGDGVGGLGNGGKLRGSEEV